MNENKCEQISVLKRSNSRYIMIRENIHEALDLYTLSLYMAFRYEADYSSEDAPVKRSAKFLYQKAKMSRRQFFLSLNILENHGLVRRDSDNQLHSISTYHVAQDLNYFNDKIANNEHEGVVHQMHGDVSGVDGGVHQMHTYHYSTPLIKNINNTNSSCSTKNEQIVQECHEPPVAAIDSPKKPKKEDLIPELIQVYREELPDNPQPHKTLLSTSLKKVLATFIKRWPEVTPDKKPLTVEAFRKYLQALKVCAPNFTLKAYETKEGRVKKNGLETFCRWDTLVKFLEEQYS